jgi:advillin
MVDAAFRNAGKTKGLEIWRIENKAPVKLDRSSYGKFHVGDSYICLSTTLRGSSLVWALHFWLGNETSQDEAGICAYKTVELDESLGGGPVQCREVQGNESNAFIALFKDTGGVEYLPGGVASGFRHVEPGTYPKRLLHVKGKRVVRVTEVPLSNASLNTGDVFILDLGLEIFIYNGASANRNEKAKGIEVASRIRNDERGGKASITVLDEDPRNNTFWTALGGFLNVTNGGEDDGAVVATPVIDF